MSSLCTVSLACSVQQKQQQVMISKPIYALNPFTVMMSVENDNNILKFEMKSLCIFLFSELVCERIFSETHSNESRFIKGQENILLAGTCVHFSALKFHWLGQ